jgi:hypothetical protein
LIANAGHSGNIYAPFLRMNDTVGRFIYLQFNHIYFAQVPLARFENQNRMNGECNDWRRRWPGTMYSGHILY